MPRGSPLETRPSQDFAADVDKAIEPLAESCTGKTPGVRREDRAQLLAALEEAAGVPAVVRAVAAAHRRRGALATGWPFVRWLHRLRPDPLRRLRLSTPPTQTSTSLPPPSDVQRAQVTSAARRLADNATRGLPPPWPRLARQTAIAADDRVADRLDSAVAGADLRPSSPRWWRLVGLFQTLLAIAVAAGAGWLLLIALLGWLRIDEVVPLPEIEGIPIPTWLFLGGITAGVALAILARLPISAGASRRAGQASRALRDGVEKVCEELIANPVERELDVRERFCAALQAARRA